MIWPTANFLDVVKDVSGGNLKIPQSEFLPSGLIPVIDQGKDFIAGFTDDEDAKFKSSDLPVIVFGDHTKAIKYIDFPFAMGADGVKVLSVNKDLDSKFFYHYLRQVKIADAGYSRHYKFLKELKIPLPPLQEQRRIAAILDKAESLRAKRREAITKLDQLLQSVFLEMFGDPVSNPKKWPIVNIEKLTAIFRDGPFGSNLKSEHYVDSGVRVIRLQNIGVWDFNDSDEAFISEEHYRSMPKNHCFPGDVLVGTLGNPNLRACIQPKEISAALNKADCLLLRPKKEVANSEYICGLLNNPSLINSLSGLSLGQTRLRISMGRLREINVPLPQFRYQENFRNFYEKLSLIKNNHAHSLEKINSLITAIQAKYFK